MRALAALAALLMTSCGGSSPPPPAQPTGHDEHAGHTQDEHGAHPGHDDHPHGHAGHQHADHGDHQHGAHEHGHAAGGHHSFSDAEKWAKVFDDPARDAWQKPDEVIAALALSPAMQVADVGAGTGYFTFRLARAVPKGGVIATDIEPDMVRYLGERATKENAANVRAVLATPADPGLSARSVDRILIVDVWHHVEGRVEFAKKLAASLRPKGQVAVVDFKLDASHGPPKPMRMPPEAIVDELTRAGFNARIAPTQLPDQYIVIGALP